MFNSRREPAGFDIERRSLKDFPAGRKNRCCMAVVSSCCEVVKSGNECNPYLTAIAYAENLKGTARVKREKVWTTSISMALTRAAHVLQWPVQRAAWYGANPQNRSQYGLESQLDLQDGIASKWASATAH